MTKKSPATALAEIYQEIFANDAHRYTAEDFANFLQLRQYNVTVFEEKHATIGALIISLAADEAEIITVFLVPDHRRKGIVTDALAQTFDRLKNQGIKQVFLEVADDNLLAQKFYNKIGFVKVGLRKNYYKRKNYTANALILRKQL